MIRCQGFRTASAVALVILCLVPIYAQDTALRCGTDWADANSRCGQLCPEGTDAACPLGQHCFRDLSATPCAGGGGTNTALRCGTDWTDANGRCGQLCPTGTNAECPSGQYCFRDLSATPCAGGSGGGSRVGVGKYVSAALFDTLFLHRRDPGCVGAFYTYEAFLTAAAAFPAFGTSSNNAINKRELAAFFGQISHETTGGWPTAPDGPYAWGLCFIREGGTGPVPTSPYCDPNNAQWPCKPGKAYYGRGPIQLSWNYNYGPAGQAIGFDGLNNPEIVETDPVIAFKTAIYFWMTAAGNKPSCHDVMTRRWVPTAADTAANRKPGYGTVTNIINGGLECGFGTPTAQENDRVGYFKRYAGILGVKTGGNLYCGTSQHF